MLAQQTRQRHMPFQGAKCRSKRPAAGFKFNPKKIPETITYKKLGWEMNSTLAKTNPLLAQSNSKRLDPEYLVPNNIRYVLQTWNLKSKRKSFQQQYNNIHSHKYQRHIFCIYHASKLQFYAIETSRKTRFSSKIHLSNFGRENN